MKNTNAVRTGDPLRTGWGVSAAPAHPAADQ